MIAPTRFLERLPLLPTRRALAYGCTGLLSLLACALRWLLDGWFPPGYPFLTFFPAVILSSFLFGRGPGVFAGLLCGLSAWGLFIPPDGFAIGPGTPMALGFYTAVVAIDIALVHWMQAANRRLLAERERSRVLAERSTLLFRELQHRISNNLQVVAALLSLQKRGIADVGARAALDEASRRLGLIGRLHRQLHDPEGARIGLAAFLRGLAVDVIEATGRTDIVWTLDADETIDLDPDAAIPLALIMAEAIANSIEHGFGDARPGRIAIRLAQEDRHVLLTLRDDGRGLAEGLDPARSESLGLRIATTLARQLGGGFTLGPAAGGGAVARLELPRG
ncbi:histidine kinase dimerization/phosphoacceptor domain -containing protein [Sphingomonas naphthae]|uniref:histidine kinase n=1 Tax=Sphingomonas naphthae TaxID=1813468 RepID=A0ABY7TNR3_9SPHN|nr:histidine kinase dimerization/phosphoacceptor domain -containing protein [Sphingomonas naphthae]WCT74035.1 histidine kinase dimerization/phosphoacceptor domain -containing protein [Sphingomonas naphthae]